jgi:hypothetical protein
VFVGSRSRRGDRRHCAGLLVECGWCLATRGDAQHRTGDQQLWSHHDTMLSNGRDRFGAGAKLRV